MCGGGGHYPLLDFYNFALGATSSIQNLYSIKRPQNEAILRDATLIITESNINDANEKLQSMENCPLEVLYRNLCWFFYELYLTKKRVLVLVLPSSLPRAHIINQIQRKLCALYGFNMIDMHKCYQQNALIEFYECYDRDHPLPFIMRSLGANIIAHLPSFRDSKDNVHFDKIPEFKVIAPNALEGSNTLKTYRLENSAFCEVAYRIPPHVRLKFPVSLVGYTPIAIHTWNCEEGRLFSIANGSCEGYVHYSQILFSNRQTTLSKESCGINTTLECNYTNAFCIDEESFVSYDCDDNAEHKETQFMIHCWFSYAQGVRKPIAPIKLGALYLCGILLAKGDVSFESVDFKHLANEQILLQEELSFDFLIPDVCILKEELLKFCKILESKECAQMQQNISALNAQLQATNAEFVKLQNAHNVLIQAANEEIKKAQSAYNMLLNEANTRISAQNHQINALKEEIQRLQDLRMQEDS